MCPKESVKNDKVIDLIKGGVKMLGVRGLARAIGISPAIITRYTQEKVGEPSLATLNKLASYFGVSVTELRGEVFTLDFNKIEPLYSGTMVGTCTICGGNVSVLLDRGKDGKKALKIKVTPCPKCCRQ
jgi:hypothetical protein